ncbi:hypothetical protein EDC55_11028 [Allofrancisella inopinata]|uniref:Uncharacterized protein n=1 Tax=Allofrancisella inopinata TaxID=1085647 RepID=A0AAE6YIG8_9GAMM|nr:hypothetical protein [Allofrancisella inopinata]QIV96037.1 hypothetical protein E4K63_04020 [Allofrancisella inopinata]TDT71695.1 hypothetical protein EDC55_11028 [Allofrancisella inopinata]
MLLTKKNIFFIPLLLCFTCVSFAEDYSNEKDENGVGAKVTLINNSNEGLYILTSSSECMNNVIPTTWVLPGHKHSMYIEANGNFFGCGWQHSEATFQIGRKPGDVVGTVKWIDAEIPFGSNHADAYVPNGWTIDISLYDRNHVVMLYAIASDHRLQPGVNISGSFTDFTIQYDG